MRLLIVSTSYPRDSEDWKGVFIASMVSSLSRKKNLSLSLWAPEGGLPSNVGSACSDKENLWFRKLVDEGGIAAVIRGRGLNALVRIYQLLGNLRRVYKREMVNTDVLHVNWLQNSIPLMKHPGPMLVTVLGTDMKLLDVPGVVPVLRYVFRNRRCIVAPNAQWMQEKLCTHFSDVATIRPIVFGIDDKWFHLYKTRSTISWENGKRTWLVVLRITEKKIGSLFHWGEDIFSTGTDELHLFGPMQENLDIPDWVHYHGATNPNELCERWFPGAAGLISLSVHDEGRPQIILEAMAAGLPVIASDIDAHEDLISHDRTGFLCKNSRDFKRAVKQFGDIEQNRRISESAHDWVKENVGNWDDCADRYMHAYDELAAPLK